MRMVSCIVLVALALTGCRSAPSAAPPLTLDAQSGLPHSAVNAIAALPDGSVAFATNEGLAIWDGTRISVYTGEAYDEVSQMMMPGNSALPHNWVATVLAARDGTLWIGCNNGLCLRTQGEPRDITSRLTRTWLPGENRIIPIDKTTLLIDGPANSHDVTCLFQASDGTIFIGTRNAGVFRYDPTGDEFKLLHRSASANQWVVAFDEDSTGAIWAAINFEGVFRWHQGKFESVVTLGADPTEVPIRSLCVDRHDAVWFSTTRGLGVLGVNRSLRFITRKDGLPDKYIETLYVDRQNRIWALGVYDSGVFADGKWCYPEIQGRDKERHSSLSAIHETESGDLWLAYRHGAVCNPDIRWHDEPRDARIARAARSRVESLFPKVMPDDYIAVDMNGHAWISSDEQLLMYDGRRWLDKSFALGEGIAFTFFRGDSSGRIWRGTHGSGLLLIDRHGFRPLGEISSTFAWLETPDGTVYVGAREGIYTMRGENWSRLLDQEADHLAMDNLGRLYLADRNSRLFVYADNKITPLSDGTLLAGFRVKSLETERDGSVRAMGYYGKGSEKTPAEFACDGLKITLIQPAPAP